MGPVGNPPPGHDKAEESQVGDARSNVQDPMEQSNETQEQSGEGLMQNGTVQNNAVDEDLDSETFSDAVADFEASGGIESHVSVEAAHVDTPPV